MTTDRVQLTITSAPTISVEARSGLTGHDGSAATVAVGSTTTGAANTAASVTNVGTSSAAILNFVIPQGAAGATGPQGATGVGGALGFYGTFYDNGSYTASTTATRMSLTINGGASGMSLSGSRVTVANAGVYNVQFSSQLLNSGSNDVNATIWVQVNGADVVDSAGVISVPAKHGTLPGSIISSWNWLLNLSAGSIVDLWWFADSTTVSMAAVTPAYGPGSPALIFTLQQVMYTQLPTPTVGSSLATTGTVNLDMTALDSTLQTIAMTGAITFTTSNRAAGLTVTVKLTANGSTRTLAFPAWTFVGSAAPASLAAGKVGVLTVRFYDSTDANAVATWTAQP